MTILVDWQIEKAIRKGKIKVTHYDPSLINPNSLDLRLGYSMKTYGKRDEPIDPYDQSTIEIGITHHKMPFDCSGITLYPGEFALATTIETITLPSNICAELNGKSSIARVGSSIHQTGGWIDCGFSGEITLELCNVNQRPVILTPGMPIGQLVFHKTKKAKLPYGFRKGSKYQNQTGAVTSRYYLNKGGKEC
jgi:dCTP deaminase